ncbi:predicted protein [Nematostella vectensis]|uniref:Uncharacterized protein n=1 Tax=Nematostella vectensis TaxID=45351 RepID=A7SGD0_NEMVE|nr:calcium homeostasis modulator protein 5 [Nematostella vectensis]EDO37248.1 predicted protein [Nematostella vectensis]|eukprot:XP_001629311.1 predicted protein [Nematostella vectensis]
MSAIQQLWTQLASFLGSAEVPLKSTIIGLVVYGAKEFFASVTFKCPSVHYKAYGYMYLFIPAAVLLCLSLMASDSFWACLTSCCPRRKKVRGAWYRARKPIFLGILLPISWLVIAFVDTQFYVCAVLGPKDIAMAKAITTAAKEAVSQDFLNAEAMSQMVAFILLLSLIACATIAITIIRLCKKVDPVINKDDLHKEEADYATKLFHEGLTPLIKGRAKGLVDDILKDAKEEDLSKLIKDGISRLADLYPAHGGHVMGEYKKDEAKLPRRVSPS